MPSGHEHLTYQLERTTEEYRKATEIADAREIADAKWNAMVRIGAIAVAVVEASAYAVQGYIGDAYKRHLEAQLESIELLRLFHIIPGDLAQIWNEESP